MSDVDHWELISEIDEGGEDLTEHEEGLIQALLILKDNIYFDGLSRKHKALVEQLHKDRVA